MLYNGFIAGIGTGMSLGISTLTGITTITPLGL